MLAPTLRWKHVRPLVDLIKQVDTRPVLVTHGFENKYFVTAPVLSRHEFLDAFYRFGYYYAFKGGTSSLVGYLPDQFGEGRMKFEDLRKAISIINHQGYAACVTEIGDLGYSILLIQSGPILMQELRDAGYITEVAANGSTCIVKYEPL